MHVPPGNPETSPEREQRAPPPPKRSNAGTTAAVLTALFGGMLLGGSCASCAGGMGRGGDEVVAGSSDRVGVVELVGMISDSTETVRQIRDMARRKDVMALVVRINSPGGVVAPSQDIYEAMRAASKTKPVVASMGALAASGGFWAAMGADYVFAAPGTITGSIGVISQFPDLRGLAELLHVNMRTYKSGPVKDLGNPLREPTPADEQVFMSMIEDIYDQFVTTVAERRKMPLEEVKKLADGRIVTGRIAKNVGLVDELGDLSAAARKAVLLAKAREDGATVPDTVEDPTLVYPKPDMPSLLQLITQGAEGAIREGIAQGIERGAASVEARAKRVPEVEAR